MKRLTILVLFLMSSLAHADIGATVPLCTDPATPDCVVPNWGQVEPDITESSIAPRTNESRAAAPAGHGARMAVQLMQAAAGTSTQKDRPVVTSVISPDNLFPRETGALATAIKRARFRKDGTIASGQAAIAAAAAAAARQAGDRYVLTLYIKVPKGFKPSDVGRLGKRVQSLNEVLASPQRESTGKPTT